jgi:hypothetical protein
MSRTKKTQKKTETMSDFQALLDSNKDKMSEGDYLALCNGMKSMFEKEEKESGNSMIICKVRILTHEVDYSPDHGYRIRPKQRMEILNLSKIHYEELVQYLRRGNMVEYANHTHESDITIYEDACEAGDECHGGCNGHLTNSTAFQRQVTAQEYITYIYPKEEWSSRSDLVRDGRDSRRDNGISYIFDH